MKILFAVHRYAPYPGGSEYNVQRTAEEMVRRGIHVTVVAGEHKGDLNGVSVTSNVNPNDFDLVIIHGGDVSVQNLFLQNIKNFNTPVLYWLIKPSESPICLQGLMDAKFIGCSTIEDWDHVSKYGVTDKCINIPYGIKEEDVGVSGTFRQKYVIPLATRMFLSCGGYWPNKKMKELVEVFKQAQLKNAVLVTTGYDNRHNLMPSKEENVIPLMIDDPKEIKDAMADADAYIMHSDAEGFGLVLLEAMLNKTPWISRNIAAAKLLNRTNELGSTYENDQELIKILRLFEQEEHKGQRIRNAYRHVKENYMIGNTVDSILRVFLK